MTPTKEKSYRLRKIMNQWHVLVYAGDNLVDDNPFSCFASTTRFAESCGFRDGDRG